MAKIKFKSEAILEEFHAICNFCVTKNVNAFVKDINYLITDIKDPCEINVIEDFFIDEITLLKIELSGSKEDYYMEMHEFFELMKVATSGKIEDNTCFLSPNLGLFYVEYLGISQKKHLSKNMPMHYFKWNENEIAVDIATGLTCFGLYLVMEGLYDKSLPPVMPNDTFIQIITNDILEPQAFREIAEAFVFELQSSYSFEIHLSIRPTVTFYDKNRL